MPSYDVFGATLALILATLRGQPLSVGSGVSGFGLAAAVMVGMVVAVLYCGVVVVRSYQGIAQAEVPAWLDWATPILSIIGLGVASYLAYIEVQALPAYCGPVGDCNTVQSSPYAKLFGVLPIGILGAAGYTAILVGWLWARHRSDWIASYASLVVFGMTLFGTLFCIYLTYLELYVIRAVCIWCLASAVIVTFLMILSVGPAMQANHVDEASNDDGSAR